jgi:hypothetical protein
MLPRMSEIRYFKDEDVRADGEDMGLHHQEDGYGTLPPQVQPVKAGAVRRGW